MYFLLLIHIADDFFALRLRIIASEIKLVKHKHVHKDGKEKICLKKIGGGAKNMHVVPPVCQLGVVTSCEVDNIIIKRINRPVRCKLINLCTNTGL